MPLQTSWKATPQEVTKAYHLESLRLHPDRNNAHNAHEQFIALQKEYEELLKQQTKMWNLVNHIKTLDPIKTLYKEIENLNLEGVKASNYLAIEVATELNKNLDDFISGLSLEVFYVKTNYIFAHPCDPSITQRNFNRSLEDAYEGLKGSIFEKFIINIAIAATGIGLLYFASNYARGKDLFFSRETPLQGLTKKIKDCYGNATGEYNPFVSSESRGLSSSLPIYEELEKYLEKNTGQVKEQEEDIIKPRSIGFR